MAIEEYVDIWLMNDDPTLLDAYLFVYVVGKRHVFKAFEFFSAFACIFMLFLSVIKFKFSSVI